MEAVARTKMNMGGVGDTISEGVGKVAEAVGSSSGGGGGGGSGSVGSGSDGE